MTAIDYSSGGVTNVGPHTVYTKATWAGSWVAQPNLSCIECAWNAAPDFNTAVLIWHTGEIVMPGDTSPTTFGPWVGRGQFVRIDWTCDDSSILRWVGYIDASSWPTESFGNQQLVCYGLERSLALAPIVDVAWLDGSTVRRSPAPPIVNQFTGRRSKNASGGIYLFDKQGDADSGFWSTKKLVQYLLKYQLPTNSFGVSTIPWSIDQASLLPDWDYPYIEMRGRTVWDLLNELVSPKHQLGFTFGSDGSTAYIRIFTHTSTNIVIDPNIFYANPNQHTVNFAPDALTDAQLTDCGGGYDQVICRGARRQSICTLRYGIELEKAWSDLEETWYEEGASGEAGYEDLNTDKQREANAKERSRPLYQDVYVRFRIPADWNAHIDTEEAFPGSVYPRWIDLKTLLPIVPKDWSGEVKPEYLAAEPTLPFLIHMADPDDVAKWVDTRVNGLKGEAHTLGQRPQSLSVSAETSGRSLALTLDGAPNHAIAGGSFTKLPVDTIDYGGLVYSTMRVTVAIEEDRFCEGKFPSTPATADVVRRLIVELGEGYRQIYIVPDTVTGIDAAGAEKKSDGGYLVDDSGKLAAIAQIIAAGVVLTRKRVSWQSKRRISAVAVGDMILTAAGATVNAPVTSIRIYAPESTSGPATGSYQAFETYRGSTDPLGMLRYMGLPL